MDEEGTLAIRKFYEVLGYGFRTGRECYLRTGSSLPPPLSEAQWIEDANFEEAADIRRNTCCEKFIDRARREGCTIVKQTKFHG